MLPVQRPTGGHGWQGALGRGSRAHATRVTTPRVLSPAAVSFYLGRWVAEAGPQGHPGHPGTLSPSPSQVLCQQRWRGLTLPSSGCFAEPGPPLSPALSPCPCTLWAAGPGLQLPPLPKPRGRWSRCPSPLPGSGHLGFCPPKARFGLAGGGGWESAPQKPPAPQGGSRGFLEAVGCCGGELGCTGTGRRGGQQKAFDAWLGGGSCLCGKRGPETPILFGGILPLRRLRRIGAS